jgi:hypothetical protein
MKQVAASLMLVVVGVLVAGSGGNAGEKKDKKLTGTITCAKCDLKVDGQTKCHTVVVVKKGDKETVYWFDAKGSKKYHGKVCTTPMKGSVTGKISKKDDKNIITVKSVEFE